MLTDGQWLQDTGVPPADRDVLVDGIPHTERADITRGGDLWAQRRGLFFKPAARFGSRAPDRGDKLTRRVWNEIRAGDYVAQALVAPGYRNISDDGPPQSLKFDVRNYIYDGTVQWMAARLYQGQATNFRTPGGGFAPVHVLPPTSFPRGSPMDAASAAHQGVAASWA